MTNDSIDKKAIYEELNKAIEHQVCKWCENYHHGEFCEKCRLCNISIVFQTIYLLMNREGGET